jgi:hypothetical protein
MFRIGNRIVDKQSGEFGIVIYVYREPELKGEIVAVRFDGDEVPLAVPIDSVRPCRED